VDDFTDVMIDIETLATTQNATIISVGAVWFRFDSDETYDWAMNVSVDGQSRDISQATLAWWLSQAGVYPSDNARSLAEVLYFLRSQLAQHPFQRIWSNHIVLDLGNLACAYEKGGLEVPWKYSQANDVATVWNLCAHKHRVSTHGALQDARDHVADLKICVKRLQAAGFALNF